MNHFIKMKLIIFRLTQGHYFRRRPRNFGQKNCSGYKCLVGNGKNGNSCSRRGWIHLSNGRATSEIDFAVQGAPPYLPDMSRYATINSVISRLGCITRQAVQIGGFCPTWCKLPMKTTRIRLILSLCRVTYVIYLSSSVLNLNNYFNSQDCVPQLSRFWYSLISQSLFNLQETFFEI